MFYKKESDTDSTAEKRCAVFTNADLILIFKLTAAA